MEWLKKCFKRSIFFLRHRFTYISGNHPVNERVVDHGGLFLHGFLFLLFFTQKKKEREKRGRTHTWKFFVIGYTLFLVIFLMFLKIFALGHVLNFCALLLQLFTTFSSFWHCVFLLRFFVCIHIKIPHPSESGSDQSVEVLILLSEILINDCI